MAAFRVFLVSPPSLLHFPGSKRASVFFHVPRPIQSMLNLRMKLFALTFWDFASARAMPDIADQALQLSTLPDLSEFYPSNPSTSSPGLSTENGFHVECNGAHFGYNLNLGDCQNAESCLSPDSRQWNFAQRHTGMEDTTFPLPYRLMGGG